MYFKSNKSLKTNRYVHFNYNRRYVESNITIIFDNWSCGLHADLLTVYDRFHRAFGLKFESIRDVNDFINSLFAGRSYGQLAEYMSLYMDRVELEGFEPSFSTDTFSFLSDKIMNPVLTDSKSFHIDNTSIHSTLGLDGYVSYNQNPLFYNFDKLVLCFNILSYVVGNCKQRAYLYKKHLERNARKYESIYSHKL